MIRAAELSDVPRLVAMGQRFLRETPYASRLVENAEQMRSTVTRMLDADTTAVFVAEDDDDLVGMIGMLCFVHPLSGESVGSELFLWVEPQARGITGLRLLRRGEQWAINQGAQKLQMIAPTADVGTLYQHLGYERVEELYQRAVA